MNLQKIRSTVLLLLLAATATAQTQPAAKATWKNRVSRVIPVVDSSAKPAVVPADSTLQAILAQLAASGKIPAYEPYATDLKKQLPVADIQGILLRHDTIEVEDPVNGAKFIKVMDVPTQMSSVTNWRVIEKWTYDETTGAGKTTILGIAPLVDVYNDYDNSFRGYISIFWFRWEDVQDIVNAYGRRHKDRDVNRLYLMSLTGGTLDPKEEMPVSIYNTRQAFLADTFIEHAHQVRTEVTDTALAELLTRKVLVGTIPAFQLGGNPLKAMPREEVGKGITPSTDTIELIDPVTGVKFQRIVSRDFSYDRITNYKLMLEWKPDMSNGEISWRVKAVAPTMTIYDDNGKDLGYKVMYWVFYKDFMAAQSKLKMYHPHIDFSTALWDAFFTK